MTQARVIADIAGTQLTSSDQDRLSHPAIAGVILFTRNYVSKSQLLSLTAAIHDINPALLITVDQEGGRVQRFTEDFTPLKPMSWFGDQYIKCPQAGEQMLRDQLETMITELREVGISSTLMPVLDLNYGHNAVIAERSFGKHPDVVTALGQVVIDTFHAHDMPVTAKHFPGHGFVNQDSHLATPVDARSFEEIESADLVPFKTLIQQCDFVMPGHVIYSAVDDKPAGFSHVWVQDILREQLGFKGQVITDDIGSMVGATSYGTPTQRAQAAIDAGCDLLLVCNNYSAVDEILENLFCYHI